MRKADLAGTVDATVSTDSAVSAASVGVGVASTASLGAGSDVASVVPVSGEIAAVVADILPSGGAASRVGTVGLDSASGEEV